MKPASVSACPTSNIKERSTLPFRSHEEAGRELAARLSKFTGRADVIVLSFPDEGALVGAEVAKSLKLPFDVLFIGKITCPKYRGLPLGTITSGGVRMLNCALIDRLCLSEDEVNAAVLRKSLELATRERLYHGHHSPIEVADHTVILVDDGSTSCSTIQSAIRLLRRQHVEKIIVALPSACQHAACDLRMEAHEVITLVEPKTRGSAGKYFKHLPRATVEDIRQLLIRTSNDVRGTCVASSPERWQG